MTREQKISEILSELEGKYCTISSSEKELSTDDVQEKIGQNYTNEKWLEKVKELISFDLQLFYSGGSKTYLERDGERIIINGPFSHLLQFQEGATAKQKIESAIVYLEQELENANNELYARREYLRDEM